METWFTSDTHFGHANIIKYCERPFATLEEMDEALIRNWNARVKHEDTVYHMGDFCFRNSPGGKPGEGTTVRARHYIDRLNGRIVIVRGNHDGNNSVKAIVKSMIINIGGADILCLHNPEDTTPSGQSMIQSGINFCGHVHNKWKYKVFKHPLTFVVNVGVDVWEYRPVNINEIFQDLARFKKEMDKDLKYQEWGGVNEVQRKNG